MNSRSAVFMDDLPPHLRNYRSGMGKRESKWRWIHEIVMQLSPDSPKKVVQFRLDNKVEARAAQSSINGSHGNHERYVSPPPGYKFSTRTEPVSVRDGAYFLYVEISPNGKSA